jgi:hypothetical protein
LRSLTFKVNNKRNQCILIINISLYLRNIKYKIDFVFFVSLWLVVPPTTQPPQVDKCQRRRGDEESSIKKETAEYERFTTQRVWSFQFNSLADC